VLFGNFFPHVIKLLTINVFNDVCDEVTCLWHLQILLKFPSDRRPNMPLLQHPKCSSATRILPCKITSKVAWFLCMNFDIDGKTPIFLLSVCLFASFSASPTGQITLKFDIGKLHVHNSRWSKFGENRTEIRDILHRELRSFYFLRRNHFRNIPLFKGSAISYAMLACDV